VDQRRRCRPLRVLAVVTGRAALHDHVPGGREALDQSAHHITGTLPAALLLAAGAA